MDIQRNLERIECKVTQYARTGEAVLPVDQVLARISVEVPRAFRVFQNPANVSGTPALCTRMHPLPIILGKALHTHMYIMCSGFVFCLKVPE